jgi:(p)ppGpp synthase/HD superfamily hydrolase
MAKNTETLELLLEKLKAYAPDAKGLELVKKAYEFAAVAHKNQKRASGEPYITHPLGIAVLLTEFQQDATTLSAAAAASIPTPLAAAAASIPTPLAAAALMSG